MIRFLTIQRLAVIDSLEIEFGSGLNVLTGETGAGKSVLVEAIGLLMGGRATPDLVRTGESAATVQAIFETADGCEQIVRREVSAQGRSRAFLEGALVSSSALKEMIGGLVDLHGQHEHQALLDPRTHLDALDEYAGLAEQRQRVAEAFDAWRVLKDDLDAIRRRQQDSSSRAEFLSFQLAELEQTAPHPGEDEELMATLRLLSNAEKLQRLCADGYLALYEGDGAALSQLGRAWKLVAELALLDPGFGRFLEARDAIRSQLEDLAFSLRSYGASIEASPARLQQIEDRLAAIERLKRKHGGTLAAVLEKQTAIGAELADLRSLVDRLEPLEHAVNEARDRYLAAARALSGGRRTKAIMLARQLEGVLGELAMDRTRCEVRLNQTEPGETAWTARGLDEAAFYISPNPGEELRPLASIASGGELSRVMLGLKTLASIDGSGKTLIFDEVDAGIGGRVADVVGSKLRCLSARCQVLCVTHLPQIAAYATTHFHIAKSVKDGRTLTDVRRLDERGRIEEIARMIGGAGISERGRASAREMLASRSESEIISKGESERPKAKRRRVG